MWSMARITPILRQVRRFVDDNHAVAAVEFALILPFLLALYLGSIEASSLITVDRRVNIISGTVGDLVARWDPEVGALSTSALTDYFDASENIIFPYPTADLVQTVSVVAVDADGLTKVLWSCSYAGEPKELGPGRDVDSTYDTIPANVNLLARGRWVVASETYYPYEPVLGVEFVGVYDLRRESFYLPRFREEIEGPSC
jgi:Flp pilus assembly protein TadG